MTHVNRPAISHFLVVHGVTLHNPPRHFKKKLSVFWVASNLRLPSVPEGSLESRVVSIRSF